MHPQKSKLIDARKESFQFLGFYIRVVKDRGNKSGKGKAIFGSTYKLIDKFKDKVREIINRNQTIPGEILIAELKDIVRGWGNYFGIGNVKGLFKKLDSWIRRRIRMVQLKSWRNPEKLRRVLKKKG